MLPGPTGPHSPQGSGPHQRFEPGQTLLFIGDHTSPDDPGYVGVISTVLGRFYPTLNLNMISAGSRGQSASGLRSRAMMDILTSSRPDWLAIGLGLADAAREPEAVRLMQERRGQLESEDLFGDQGPGMGDQVQPRSDPPSPIPHPRDRRELELVRLAAFRRDLGAAASELLAAGVHPILLTTAPFDNDRDNPANLVLTAYNKAIRELAQEHDAPLVDLERAFRDVFDRAANYKQKVALVGSEGRLNAQGQSLVARTFLQVFGLLPGAGSHR
jgi:lysophospholipase L1-like esterase